VVDMSEQPEPDRLNILGETDPHPRQTDNGPKPGDGPDPDPADIVIAED